MAEILYADMVRDVIAHASGCPSIVVETAIKNAVVESCKRARVYIDKGKVDVTLSIDASDNTSRYNLASLVDSTVDLLSVYDLFIKGKKLGLVPANRARIVFKRNVSQSADGITSYTLVDNGNTILFYPVFEGEINLYYTLVLTPNDSSVSVNDEAYSEIKDAVFHGSLQRLLTMPSKSWTDLELAAYHAKQFVFKLSLIRATYALAQLPNTSLTTQLRVFV